MKREVKSTFQKTAEESLKDAKKTKKYLFKGKTVKLYDVGFIEGYVSALKDLLELIKKS